MLPSCLPCPIIAFLLRRARSRLACARACTLAPRARLRPLRALPRGRRDPHAIARPSTHFALRRARPRVPRAFSACSRPSPHLALCRVRLRLHARAPALAHTSRFAARARAFSEGGRGQANSCLNMRGGRVLMRRGSGEAETPREDV